MKITFGLTLLSILLNINSVSASFFSLYQGNFQEQQNPEVLELSTQGSTGFPDAVIVNDVPLIHTAQLFPTVGDKKGKKSSNIKRQVDQLLNQVEEVLQEAGSGLDNAVKLNVYISRNEHQAAVRKHLEKQFRKHTKPAVTFVAGDLLHSDSDVAMDVIATVSKPSGDLVQGNIARFSILPSGGVTYVSGQAAPGDLREATQGTLKQLESTIASLGIPKGQIIQIKSFLRPMSDAELVVEEFRKFFDGKTIPPLVFVDWLSTNPVIEIELIASSTPLNSQSNQKLRFITPPGMSASPIYSKVVQLNSGRKIYTSGIYGNTMKNSAAQTREIFEKLNRIFQQANSDLLHLAKATYYVADDEASASLNQIRPTFYNPDRPPAASKAKIKGTGVDGMNISIDMIGVVK